MSKFDSVPVMPAGYTEPSVAGVHMTLKHPVPWLLLGMLAAACSSSRPQQSDQSSNPGFNVGGSGSADDFAYDGGVASLTADQVKTLRSASCAGWSHEGEMLPAQLDFVVDVSGSMGLQSPTTGSQTKWDITKNSLKTALAQLPASTAVGMLFFPNRSTHRNTTGTPLDVTQCVNTSAMIPIDLLGATGSAQRTALAAGLDAAQAAGGTPTDDAYEYELANDMKLSKLLGQRFMVLITDGQPTFLKGCMGTGDTADPVDYNPIIVAIKGAWDSSGIKTFVIGSPGSEAQASTGADGRGWLSQAAQVGHTPLTPDCNNTGPNYCHFDMSQVPDFAAGFSDALAQIAGQVVSCSYSIPAPPPGQTLDLTKINLVLTTGAADYSLVLRANSSACTTGWYFDGSNNIVLCSETCKQAKADSTASLDLLFGCATLAIPVN